MKQTKIKMDTQCYLCYLQRCVETARSLGDEDTAIAFTKEMMGLFLSAPEGVASPWFGPAVSDLFTRFYGVSEDRFFEEKQESNRFILDRMPQIRSRIESAADPVFAGLQMAILGNYIDFSALRGEVSFEKLDQMLDQAGQMRLDETAYRHLCGDLEKGKRLLYITDNAGEIGFDRLFAEAVHKRYPHIAITFCVRGAPASNDATRADAAAVGIPFPVIDNGTRIAGTQLDMLGGEAKNALEAADVILSKGQANVETLLGCGYNIYYAFLVKCRRFIDIFQKPKLTPMLIREKDERA